MHSDLHSNTHAEHLLLLHWHLEDEKFLRIHLIMSDLEPYTSNLPQRFARNFKSFLPYFRKKWLQDAFVLTLLQAQEVESWLFGTARLQVMSLCSQCIHMILIFFRGARMRAKNRSVPLWLCCCFQVRYIYVVFVSDLSHAMFTVFGFSKIFFFPSVIFFSWHKPTELNPQVRGSFSFIKE